MSATRKPIPLATAGEAKPDVRQPKSTGYLAKRRDLSARLKIPGAESEALAIDAGLLPDRLTN
jgi:hypothetical protein